VPETRLRETLEELERELGRTEAIDDRSRELLDHVCGEVRELLERTGEPEERHLSLRDRLAEATREFETDHPTLAEVVGRVAAALSNLGI
jgi:hypothetical protein